MGLQILLRSMNGQFLMVQTPERQESVPSIMYQHFMSRNCDFREFDTMSQNMQHRVKQAKF